VEKVDTVEKPAPTGNVPRIETAPARDAGEVEVVIGTR